MKIPSKALPKRPGLTFIDSVLSLVMIGIMVLIYAGLVNIRDTDRRVSFRAEAAALADEEINALKRADVTTLSNQTSGDFVHVLSNAGAWTIATDAANLDATSSPCPPAVDGQHCGANVVTLAGNTAFSGKESGRLLLPAGAYGTATIQANWKILADSPAGWATGYWFQTLDKNNGYRLRLAATTTDLDSGAAGTQNLVVEKISSGSATILFSKSNVSVPVGSWNTLKIVLDPGGAATIKVFVNGVQQDIGTITDTSFTSGAAALLAWGGIHAEVDDVMTTTTSTARWDFEGSSQLPAGWRRIGLNDLPDSTSGTFDDNGRLTLVSYPNVNSTTLKLATIVISWTQATGTASYSITSLIGNSGVGL